MKMQKPSYSLTLRRSLILITTAGSLGMVYIVGTTSPVFTEFLRTIGAREFHFGLIGGIPMIMLCMQFVGAVVTNHVRKRKALFMTLVIVGRMLYIPIAFIPILLPSLREDRVLVVLILLITLSSALTNVTGPLWFSWMADLIPRRVLDSYWGRRQYWIYITWTTSFVGIVVFTYLVKLPVTIVFPILATIVVTAGVMDILLFTWVKEPPNMVTRIKSFLETMLDPLRHKEYRSFVLFSCTSSVCVMFSAAFMQLYVLKVLCLPLWQTTLIWCVAGVGIALASTQWGRIADKHGHKPVLAICTVFKPIIVIVFFLITRSSAPWVLSVIFLIDGFWNAGVLVAENGYMLKISPRQNRSMFIATFTALGGICGGLGAMAGGSFLHAFSDFSLTMMGRTWNNYHLLFFVNIFMRLGCIILVFKVREVKSSAPAQLLHDILGVWPMRFLLFPIGLYRKLENSSNRDNL